MNIRNHEASERIEYHLSWVLSFILKVSANDTTDICLLLSPSQSFSSSTLHIHNNHSISNLISNVIMQGNYNNWHEHDAFMQCVHQVSLKLATNATTYRDRKPAGWTLISSVRTRTASSPNRWNMPTDFWGNTLWSVGGREARFGSEECTIGNAWSGSGDTMERTWRINHSVKWGLGNFFGLLWNVFSLMSEIACRGSEDLKYNCAVLNPDLKYR